MVSVTGSEIGSEIWSATIQRWELATTLEIGSEMGLATVGGGVGYGV